MKKIQKEIIEALKEEYKFILVLILITVILLFPLDYYITTGGGIKSIDSRIKIENAYKQKGSFNMCYVSQLRGNVLTYLLSYVIPNWEKEEIKDYQYNSKENYKDIEYRNKIELETSTENAKYNAYSMAKKDVNTISHNILVLATVEEYPNDFKIGDEIISIEDKKLPNLTDYVKMVNTKEKDDIINVKVKRNNKEENLKAKVYEEKDVKIIGLYLTELYKCQTNPKVKIKFASNEEGPSGGLLTALSIYNKLVKKDITKGKTIAGTGTITHNGNIGSVGGIKYKLIGANKKADVFLVPKGNYKEAKKIKKDKNLKIKIIKVSTFKEAISKLNNI